MPESRTDVHFEGEWTKTASGEDFLMAEDGEGEDRLIMFATEVNIKLLCEAQPSMFDGTFQTCPRLFYQIFTIHAFKNGRQFPLVNALLPNKSQATYVRVLELEKQKADSLQVSLEPQIVLSDFELAIKQAVELSFPTTDFRGCYYHFSQALMRKCGLHVAYREDANVNRFIRRTAALAFVPVCFVRLAWQASNFPLTMWNVYWSDSFRTNNHLEGWHNHLKRLVGKAHPNVYEFVEVIQKEQTTTEVSITQLEAGAHPLRRALKAITRDRKIQELKQRFDTNTTTLRNVHTH